MKKYHILEGQYMNNLEEVVTSYLNDGWKLAGGVAVVEADDGHLYFWQAMTKDEK